MISGSSVLKWSYDPPEMGDIVVHISAGKNASHGEMNVANIFQPHVWSTEECKIFGLIETIQFCFSHWVVSAGGERGEGRKKSPKMLIPKFTKKMFWFFVWNSIMADSENETIFWCFISVSKVKNVIHKL